MSLLFETIRIVDGRIKNPEYHNTRFNKSRWSFFKAINDIELERYIHIPPEFSAGIVKCKLVYDIAIQGVCFCNYAPRIINTIQLVNGNHVNYNFKFTNREQLNKLVQKRSGADEILIVQNGFITDTSFSNIILFDGDKWVTPDCPLLSGTMRSYLLDQNMITEQRIAVKDLIRFQSIRLINAMLPFESGQTIPIENIRGLDRQT